MIPPHKLIIALLLMGCTAFAQQFTVQAKVDGIKQSGLHSIPLSAEFRTYADANLGGLRLIDSKGNEVPYFINIEQQSEAKYGYTEYPLVYKKKVADTVSEYVVKNNTGKTLRELTLAIANTDAAKTYTISGSYDDVQWFGLVNNQQLDGLYSPTDTLVYKTVSMPPNAYPYLKVSFSDKKSLPINVISIGKVTGSAATPPILQKAYKPFIQTLEMPLEKKTRITVSFNTPVTVNRVSLDVKGPSLYNRDMVLLLPRTRMQRKKKVPYFETAGNYVVSSTAKNSFAVNLTESTFVFEIFNRDNLPLDISGVTVWQDPVNLVADLKSGETYTLKGGDPTLPAADYDLADFRDKIQSGLPVAALGKPAVLKPQPNGINGTKSSWIMWVCIAAGALVLGYFCLNLVTDMKKGQGKAS